MIPLFPVQKYRAIITDIPDTSRLMLHVRMIDDIYIYIYIYIYMYKLTKLLSGQEK